MCVNQTFRSPGGANVLVNSAPDRGPRPTPVRTVPGMSTYSATLGGRTHSFAGLAGLLAAASPERSGDRLAGLAADSAQARVAARWALAEVPLARFLAEPVIPYETDDVTRLIMDSHDAAAFAPVSGLTVGE